MHRTLTTTSPTHGLPVFPSLCIMAAVPAALPLPGPVTRTNRHRCTHMDVLLALLPNMTTRINNTHPEPAPRVFVLFCPTVRPSGEGRLQLRRQRDKKGRVYSRLPSLIRPTLGANIWLHQLVDPSRKASALERPTKDKVVASHPQSPPFSYKAEERGAHHYITT